MWRILEKINFQIRSSLNLQQWRSTQDTIDWFKNLNITKDSFFLQLDIVDFYPSISKELSDKALEFASNFERITDEEIKSIKENAEHYVANYKKYKK